jgi:hypothetical protein
VTLPEVTVRVDRTQGTTHFRLEPVANVMTVAVTRHGESEPLWWLVPDTFVHAFPFTVDSSPARDDTPGDRPEPSTWSESSWEQRMLSDRSNRLLAELIYGQVPAGFRQAAPSRGEPQPLEAGQRYCIILFGACQAHAEFIA